MMVTMAIGKLHLQGLIKHGFIHVKSSGAATSRDKSDQPLHFLPSTRPANISRRSHSINPSSLLTLLLTHSWQARSRCAGL